MKLNEDKVPCNLKEAITFLKESITNSELDAIKASAFINNGFHFTLGMHIRNAWSLWEKDTKLVQWFFKTYGVDFADDISKIILDSFFRDVRGEPRRDKKLAKQGKEHWKEMSQREA